MWYYLFAHCFNIIIIIIIIIIRKVFHMSL